MNRYRNIIQTIAAIYLIYLGIKLIWQVYVGLITTQGPIFVIVGIIFIIIGLVILWMIYKRVSSKDQRSDL